MSGNDAQVSLITTPPLRPTCLNVVLLTDQYIVPEESDIGQGCTYVGENFLLYGGLYWVYFIAIQSKL